MPSPAPRKLSYAPLQPGQIRLLSIDPASGAKAEDKSPVACRLAHCHLEEFAGGWPSTDNESRVWPGSEQSHYDYRSMFDRGMRGKVHFKDGDDNSQQGPARKPKVQHHPALTAELNAHDGDDGKSLTSMYITMSYAWGPPTPAQTILVDGAETEVTGNLHALLTELRRSEWVRRGVRVWIDALCINQGDNAEKEQQVRIMRRIYEMAWQVVVWLGPATQHTATAFAAVSWLADAMGTEARLADFWSRNKTYRSAVTPWSMNTYPLFPWRAEVFLALRAFFAQNYWHRLWILQELAMARLDAPVLWGAHAVSLRAIYAAARLIESRETEMGQHISSPGSAWNESGVGLLKDRRLHDRQGCPERQWKLLLRIAAMRRTEGVEAGGGGGEHGGSSRSRTDSGGEALIDTLYLSRGAGASEPRDKVYGILGLPTIASTVDISTLAPNYALASSEVYVNFTRAVLARGDLNTLRFVHSPVGDVFVKWKKTGWVVTGVPILNAAPEPVTPRCPHQLPSWVVCHLCAPPLSVFLSGKYHADLGLGGCITQETQAQPAPADNKLLWRCDAVFVDEVATLSAFNFSEADPTYPYNGGGANGANTNPLPNAYGDLEGLRQALWRTIVADSTRHGQTPAPADGGCLLDPRFWARNCPYWPRGPGIQFGLGDFLRRNGGLVLPGGSTLRRLINGSDENARFGPQRMRTTKVPEAFAWAANVMAWRRLVGTRCGRVGLCVPAAKAGDRVAVLMGCGMPLLLRPSGDGGGAWSVVGECYLHGVMDGEVADGVRRGELRLEAINLV